MLQISTIVQYKYDNPLKEIESKAIGGGKKVSDGEQGLSKKAMSKTLRMVVLTRKIKSSGNGELERRHKRRRIKIKKKRCILGINRK